MLFMDLPVTPTGSSFPPTGIHPERERRRSRQGQAASDRSTAAFDLLKEDAFDSSAPVAVDAATEVALADLKPTGAVTLAEAIHRYTDDD